MEEADIKAVVDADQDISFGDRSAEAISAVRSWFKDLVDGRQEVTVEAIEQFLAVQGPGTNGRYALLEIAKAADAGDDDAQFFMMIRAGKQRTIDTNFPVVVSMWDSFVANPDIEDFGEAEKAYLISMGATKVERWTTFTNITRLPDYSSCKRAGDL